MSDTITVRLGNTAPLDHEAKPVTDLGFDDFGEVVPTVTSVTIPGHEYDPNIDLSAFKNHLADAIVDGHPNVTNFPGSQALLSLVGPAGKWQAHSAKKPSWIDSDDPVFAELLSRWYGGVPLGAPDHLEDTHYTESGPPGIIPAVAAVKDIQNLLLNMGRDTLSRNWLGSAAASLGYYGTATATAGTATSGSLTATGTPWSANQWVGYVVIAGGYLGVIGSNTSSVLTVDRWTNIASPQNANATAPSSTTTFTILPGGAPTYYVGLGYVSTAPVATDTTMSGEVIVGTPSGEANSYGTPASSGLLRQLAVYAHTAGTTTTTLTPVYIGNVSDGAALTGGITIYRAGAFNSLIPGSANTIGYETTLSASASLSAVGDTLTLTWTVTSI